ncbi:MAG: DNA polymerase III subunit beta [Lachnospiraceae bacterium]|nr:DNA polymerase III subunit beta [Lachnospiraceae bacterium]
MKFSVSKNDLQNAISTVIKAVPVKSNLTNADCILVDAKDDEIRLVANNSEMAIECICTGRVLEEGSVCLESKMFQELIRKLPDDLIEVECDKNYLTTVHYKDNKYDLIGKETDTFNDIPVFDYKEHLDIFEFSLKEIIRQTIFSISDNEANKTLRGELFEIKDGILRVVSLDGQRVSIRRIEIEDKSLNKKIIVPGKSLNDLFNILGKESNGMATMHFTDNHLIVTFESTTFVTRLIDGEFFNIDNVLSKEYSTKITINKKELYDCVDRSTIFAREGDKKAIVLSIGENIIEMYMNSSKGSMREKIEIEKSGNDLKIGFNPKYLTDALRAIDDETIHLYLSTPKSPLFIRDDADSFTYMILPVNLGVEGDR